MKKSEKKEQQEKINDIVLNIIDETYQEEFTEYLRIERLRTCQAWVKETPRFFLLQSYNTIVACIEKDTDTLYDFLRFIYGFTSTSCQHIAKFNHDYSKSQHGCKNVYTYRDI